MAEHEPNQGLRELLNEARWTQAESAAAINRAAAEAGVPPTCDKSNVNKWLGGTRPQAKWHPLIVEAFSRRLGRPVTRVEAGLPPSVAETGTLAALTLPGDTVEGLVSIGREDMDPSRRRILTTMLYAAALPVPYIDLADQTRGVECRKDSGVVDEIPAAYKPIDQVIAAQRDLVEVVAELRQVVCVKG
jgi:hypothetical protein